MAQFVAFDPAVEVNGQTVLAIVAGMGPFKDMAMQILTDNGIEDPSEEQWYSQQAWLDAFKVIADTVGPDTLYQIGTKIPENADWPPDINSVESALATLDVAYHMNHRFGEIGHYNFSATGDRSGIMVCPNPYPCEFDRGIVEAVAIKFSTEHKNISVKHDDSQPCRKTGGISCTLLISW